MFDELTPAQQEHVATAGLRSLEQIRTIATWTRQEKERQEKAASDASVNAGVQMIYNSQKFGKFSIKDVTEDPAMDGDTKHRVISWYLQDQERRKAGASVNDQGERNRLYQDFVRQAQEGNAPSMRMANDAVLSGRLTPESHTWLQARAANIQNDSGTSFGIAFKKAARGADTMIQRGIARFDPVSGAQIMERAKGDLYDAYEAQKDELQKAGKATGGLVDPTSKEFMFSPVRVDAAVNAAMAGVGGAQVEAVAKADTDNPKNPKTGEAITVGATYDLGNGPQVYLGGNPRVSTSWSAKGADVSKVVLPPPVAVTHRPITRMMR
jgi:hypothetical protein